MLDISIEKTKVKGYPKGRTARWSNINIHKPKHQVLEFYDYLIHRKMENWIKGYLYRKFIGDKYCKPHKHQDDC